MRTVVCGGLRQNQRNKHASHKIKIYKIKIKNLKSLTMTDPNLSGPNPHPTCLEDVKEIRIVTSYTEEQVGQDIRSEDVVRPKNH